MTPLETAFDAMQAAPEDDGLRLRYYAALADSMLVVLREGEADLESAQMSVRPKLVEIEGGQAVLAYDSEEALTEAAGAVVDYVTLPGRVIVQQLAGQSICLGVNLGAEKGAFLLEPEGVDWLAQTLSHRPETTEALPIDFSAPGALPAILVSALDGKIARAAGLAQAVLIAAVRYEGGRRGHLLAWLDARADAQDALARAAGEALTFSGVEAGEMDVVFLQSDSAAAQAMARVALRIDLPEPEAPQADEPLERPGPGMDPAKPPILR